MLELLLVVFGSLGLGILAAFFVAFGGLFFGSEGSDKVWLRLASVVGVVTWVALIRLQAMFPQPLWLWTVLYMICWILDVIAWIFFEIFFSRRD